MLARAFLLLIATSFAVSCTNSGSTGGTSLDAPAEARALRPLNESEALEDFRELVGTFRSWYGPMEYKEKLLGFSFEAWASEIEAELKNAKSDAEIFGLYAKFTSKFQDGHVGISFATQNGGAMKHTVPLFLVPVEGKTLVGAVLDPKLTSIMVGDEIVSIDGQTPDDLLKIILKYQAFATPASNKHWIFKALMRDFYITELAPKKNTVTLVVRKWNGSLVTEELVWKVEPSVTERFVLNGPLSLTVPALPELQAAAGASLLGMAKPKPFFATPTTMAVYNMRVVTASDEYRAKYGLTATDKPDIFAALYKFEGKTILLVRNFVYHHSDFPNSTYMKGYKAILDQWEDLADVLVLDQTHNGGGSYCEEFFRLFIKEQKAGFVQSLNVDRKWIVGLRGEWAEEMAKGQGDLKRVFQAMGSVVEKAYDSGEKMTEFLPIIGGSNRVTPLEYTWKKPMLVLVDELAGSCGDAFPMLVKNNNVAKIFGTRTMGLGGNVEPFTLRNSQTSVRLTRGLFTSFREDGQYAPELLVENNGVIPDYQYEHTVNDFRMGFVGYVREFSKKAIEQK